MNTVEQFHYPDDIEDEKFNNRRVTFMALTGEVNDDQKEYLKGITKSQESIKSNENLFKKIADNVQLAMPEELKESEGIIKKATDEGMKFVKKFVSGSELKCLITLPLPGSLSDTQQHEWRADTYISAIGDLVTAFAKKTPGGEKFVKSTIDVFNQTIRAGGVITNHIGVRKPILNPGYFQNYTSSGLRTFSFSFNFIAESQSEAKSIREIIKAFKRYSSPSEWADKYILLSPFKWMINVSNGVVNELISLHECVCTSVGVTYGNDKFDCFEDGMPKKITLSLNFSECSLQYADNYSNTENVENVNTSTTKNNAVEVAKSSLPSHIRKYYE
jgi:hypothetical protein